MTPRLGTFFEVTTDDVNHADRWFLGEPLTAAGEEIDAREFTVAKAYKGPIPATLPIDYDGKRIQFNLGALDMPVVSSSIEQVLRELAPNDVDFYSVGVSPTSQAYSIANVRNAVTCVDEQLSEFELFSEADGRPELVGRYSMIYELRIDPHRVGHAKIFRIADFEIALVVHVSVKEALEECEDLGVKFTAVG